MGSQNTFEKSSSVPAAIDMLHQVRSVNHLIQGLCSRLPSAELSQGEGEGLYHLMDWQNEKILMVENLLVEKNQ
jgi:hypothetical protein